MSNKSLERIENLMDYLEKFVHEEENRGRDNRVYYVNMQYKTYFDYNSDIFEESVDIMEHARNLIKKFFKLALDVVTVSNNYLNIYTKRVHVLLPQYMGMKSDLSREEKMANERDMEETTKKLASIIKELLIQTGLIDILLNSENRSLKDLGLSSIVNMIDIEKLKEDLLSPDKLKANGEIENAAIFLFWSNKLAKVIDSCMLGYLLDKGEIDHNSAEKIDVQHLDNRKKYIALMRMDLIKMILKYMQENNISFSDAFNEETSKYETWPEEFRQMLESVTRRYETLFAKEGKNQNSVLAMDIFILDSMNTTKESFYALKNMLTNHLISLLALSNEFAYSSRFPNWGIIKDDNPSNDNMNNIFYFGIPGYMKPVMVHVRDELMEGLPGVVKPIIKTYNGNFCRSNKDAEHNFLSTNLLFRLTQEQLTFLKNARKKQANVVRNGESKLKKAPDDYSKILLEREKEYLEVIKEMECIAKNTPYHAPVSGGDIER